ncbi:MMPL family transporter [Streptomyces sp. NPDC059866]|uniref:MMPL family transporter n=1 Tax=Streptomyces sp. NPDC059866 TaxID=3346978 RepID=UPI003656074F
MATFLYKLGRFAFRRRLTVIFTWILLLVLAGVGASAATAPSPSTFSMPGTESQRALDVLEERFPGSNAEGAAARMVFKAPEGERIEAPEHRAEIARAVASLRKSSSQVAAVTDPFTARAVSKDGTTAYTTVAYKVGASALTDGTRNALKDAVDESRTSGLTVETGGSAVQAESESGTEVLGIVIAAIVLLVTFGSLVAAGLPLITALLGVVIGVSAIGALAHTLDLGDTTSQLAMMLGLAVGIDYALFIVVRYRAELAEGLEREEAAGRAVGTAGSAVVFAGLTVVIALAGLSVVGIPMLTKMGLAAAVTVALAVLVALTLLPALLRLAGKRIVGRRARSRDGAKRSGAKRRPKRAFRPGASVRWAGFVLRRPIPVLVAGVVGLGALSVPAASLELGLPDEGSLSAENTQRKAYDLLTEGFGAGFNGPLTVVVDARDSADRRGAAADVVSTVRALDGVAAVGAPGFNGKADTATITVVPASGPSSDATESLVRDIREAHTAVASATGARAMVTGPTALKLDFTRKMNDALLPYLALVVGLAFLLLMVVFRSVLVPLKAALGFLLSVGAALGAVVAVFQWGWLADLFGVDRTGPIMSTMPIFMVGIIFGLAMDYEVFLVTRIREAHVRGASPVQAVKDGFRHGGRVVTAAALIMVAVFGSFLGAAEEAVKMIGFGLAVAVVLDAFVVRMTLVPAVLALLGRHAWWLPGWLRKVLPSVDVEGEKLRGRPDGTRGEDPEVEYRHAEFSRH